MVETYFESAAFHNCRDIDRFPEFQFLWYEQIRIGGGGGGDLKGIIELRGRLPIEESFGFGFRFQIED